MTGTLGDPGRLLAEAERLEAEASVHARAAAQLRRLAARVRREHATCTAVCAAPHPVSPAATCQLAPHPPEVLHDATPRAFGVPS